MNKTKLDDPIDVLGGAYEKLYEHVVADIHKLKDVDATKLDQIIEKAKEKAIELERLTKEDEEKLTKRLKRDFEDTII